MPEDFPDVYADQFRMTVSAYGVSLVFQKSPTMPVPGQSSNETTAVVRMSLEHAKVMTMLLKRQLKQFELEFQGDPINLPRRLLDELKLSLEEW